MEEQIDHIKKVKAPFTKRFPEDRVRASKKRSRVMIVEEPERLYSAFAMRHNSSASNLKVTPMRVSRHMLSRAVLDEGEIRWSYATEEPSLQCDTSLEEDASPFQSYASALDKDHAASRKDSSAYNALKNQLNRLTLELRREDSEQDLGKHRRTREDRKVRLKLQNNATALSKELILGRLNRSQDAIKITDEIVPSKLSLSKMKYVSKVSKPHARDSFKKPAKQPTKENAKPVVKFAADSNRRSKNSRKHIARTYLGELYTRIMFKVKEIERERKTNVPLKNACKCSERTAPSRQDTSGINSLKKLIHALKNKNTHK